jgi:ATPase subunit of ABC transporter with duplicated ATPase domains
LVRYDGGWRQYWAARTAERERLADSLDVARRERDAAQAKLRVKAQKRSRQQQHAAANAARGGMPRLLLGARKRYEQQTSGRRAMQAAGKTEDALQAAHAAWKALKVDPVMYAGIAGTALPAQGLVAMASSFNVCFGDWIYARDLDFTWRGNVRMAIQGRNGSGKSTLLEALRGMPLCTRGELRHGDVSAIYLDQRCAVLRDDLSVLANVALHCNGREDELRNTLAQFLFTGDEVQQQVATLSGGERFRAALALEFMRAGSPAVMLLDEPTNNLDAANVEFLEEIVGGFRGALVVVSHDQRFLGRCGVTAELVMS